MLGGDKGPVRHMKQLGELAHQVLLETVQGLVRKGDAPKLLHDLDPLFGSVVGIDE